MNNQHQKRPLKTGVTLACALVKFVIIATKGAVVILYALSWWWVIAAQEGRNRTGERGLNDH